MPKHFRAIASMTENLTMGFQNELVCRDKRDFAFFKEKTMDNVIVMGRKTYESIGKPLPYRYNIVVTRRNIKIPGTKVVHSMKEINPNNYGSKDVYIIGGANLLVSCLDKISDFYLTVFHCEKMGDISMPREFFKQFQLKGMLAYYTEFEIRHYVNPNLVEL